MSDTEKRDRGQLRVNEDECKGCGLCVEACPPKVIRLSERLNHSGYRTALYAGKGCTGCGICFMACPEPGALTVMRLTNRTTGSMAATEAGLDRSVQGVVQCASN